MVRHWPAWVGERNRNHESLRTRGTTSAKCPTRILLLPPPGALPVTVTPTVFLSQAWAHRLRDTADKETTQSQALAGGGART